MEATLNRYYGLQVYLEFSAINSPLIYVDRDLVETLINMKNIIEAINKYENKSDLRIVVWKLGVLIQTFEDVKKFHYGRFKISTTETFLLREAMKIIQERDNNLNKNSLKQYLL